MGVGKLVDGPSYSCNLIEVETTLIFVATDVIEEINIGENNKVALEINHAYHDHNLILTFTGEIEDDNNCYGCMGSLSQLLFIVVLNLL